MPIEILMPALSPTMTEGTLSAWLKAEGDPVAAGDVIAEIETDKATMEVEAVDEGVLGKILVAAGSEQVAVNSVIGLILEDGEESDALKSYVGGQTNIGGQANPSNPTPTASATQASAHDEAGQSPEPKLATPKQQNMKAGMSSSGRIIASPLARRIAREKGIDLSGLRGTGPHGRIVRVDVETASKAGHSQTERAQTGYVQTSGSGSHEAQIIADALGVAYHVEPLTKMRQTIARRLSESKQTVPHFYLTADCEIDALLAARGRLNSEHDLKISVNDMIIKAAAVALRQVPEANVSYMDDAMLIYDQVDISVAVAIPGGLVTPVVRNADQLGLAAISSQVKTFASRAREGKLAPEDYTGGSFSVSNLGMFGVKQFEAIINPPQACILAVGAGEQRPIVRDGALEIGTVMTVSLSVDHRAVDGAVGARLLKSIKSLIENPVSMLI